MDYADLVVKSILENQEARKTSGGAYHFLDVDIGYMIDGEPLSISLYGRLVKDMILVSEQSLDEGKLIAERKTLPSSPSAFFVFNLADHRLAYMPETKMAPTIKTFGNTLDFFIKKKHDEMLRRRWAEVNTQEERVTLKSLREEWPLPIVHVVPIADKLAVEAFLKRFESISEIVVHVVRRNQDYSPGGLFDALSEDVSELEPTSSRLVVNGGKEGLNMQKAVEFIGDIAEHGYEDTKISGKNAEGYRMSGTNADYSLSRAVDETPLGLIERAKTLYEQYVQAKEDGQIRMRPRDAEALSERLRRLVEKHG
ncbi:hypothetical protein EYE35_12685 [Cereibacter sphaeroides]|nr:hypothetical protein EYE35_12685 [Cereibacter sphaeroides]